ncbi:MAG TPA: hypothetical protein H9976_01250 [Candidatus Akkermansia intestinavium]|nr:hypothetical protein [Candidatus Akkermansia intestinavium]
MNAYRYTVIENKVDPPEPSLFQTCKEAWEGALDGELVFRDGELVTDPKKIECYQLDIQDLKEALKYAIKDEVGFRRRVRSFVKAYMKESPLNERLNISPALVDYIQRLAHANSMTEEDLLKRIIQIAFYWRRARD